ncbi:MAG: YaaR family protein [Oscillospiraceae bacterium]|jgi:uncharacterized protein YaaR (DUF327 family)|nr:YaaR family protein [Oscillospiraceae bacterium]
MIIRDLPSIGHMVRSGAPVGGGGAAAGKGHEFRDAIQGVTRQNAEQKLAQMSAEITRQGAVLGRRVDILELKRFKEMITEYVGEAVRFMYEHKRQSSFDARGRHKIYTTIKKLNDKLEEMTQKILDDEKGNLDMLADIDEVCGLLIDIFL